jgi:hypothetical protein
MYRADGPVEMRPVGEVEFVAGIAAMSASGGYGPIKWPKASSGTPTSRSAIGLSRCFYPVGTDCHPVFDTVSHVPAAR